MDEFVKELLKIFIYNPIYWIIIIGGIISTVFYKKIIGKAGEYWVKKELKKLSNDYLVINDVMLLSGNKTCQIDHLVISKYGIFVIETKHYNGYIKGNDYDKSWIIYSNKKKYYTNNPIHQNYGHMMTLINVLDLPKNVFFPFVCISSRAKVNIKSENCILLENLLIKINQYNKVILPNYKDIYYEINNKNITDKKMRKMHIKNVKGIVSKKQIDNINKCPLCGEILVERKSKYGIFLGCSNYPKCKYIKK